MLSIGSALGSAHGPPIPAGTYVSPTVEEQEIVREDTIRFRIRLAEGEPLVDRQYDFHVTTDGRIQPYPMTSVDAGLGVGRFEWRLRGGAILREERRTGATTRFVADAPAPPGSRRD